MLRMRRRWLVGAAVGTAVVVGTAGAVSHHQQQKYANQSAAAQDQQEQPISRVWLTRRLNNSSTRRLRRSMLPRRPRLPRPAGLT